MVSTVENTAKDILVPDNKNTALMAARCALDKKATDVKILCVGPNSSVADYFVLCTAQSEPQANAIADHIQRSLRELGERPLGIEGADASQWIILDYNDVIIHVFRHDTRQVFRFDEMWNTVERIPIPQEYYS